MFPYNKLKIAGLALFFLLFFSCHNNAQQAFDNPEKIMDGFFKILNEKDPNQALDFLFASNTDPNLSKQIEELKTTLTNSLPALGNCNGQQLITRKKVANSFVYYSYLMKYDKQPIRFIFIFYQPQKTWKIYKFKFDSDLENEIEDAGRIYFLK